MKTIAFVNQKGGVGKTTLALHFAFHAQAAGNRVLVVDLDSQGNAAAALPGALQLPQSATLFNPPDATEIPAAPLAVMPGSYAILPMDTLQTAEKQPRLANFLANLKRYGQHYDICVIDTATVPSFRQQAALIAADCAASPIELDSFSMKGIEFMLKNIMGIRERYNPRLRFLGMIPNKVNTGAPVQKAALAELVQKYSNYTMKHALVLRSSVSEASAEGKPVWDIKKSSARDAGREMRAVVEQLYNALTETAHAS